MGAYHKQLGEIDNDHEGRDVLQCVHHKQGLDPVYEQGAIVARIGEKHAIVVGMDQPQVAENLIEGADVKKRDLQVGVRIDEIRQVVGLVDQDEHYPQ